MQEGVLAWGPSMSAFLGGRGKKLAKFDDVLNGWSLGGIC